MKKISSIALISTTLIIFVFLVFTQYQKTKIPEVNFNSLRKELVTDKVEYNVGEQINATLFVYNDEPYNVKFKAIKNYYITGYSLGDQNKIIDYVSVTTTSEYKIIPKNSRLKIADAVFIPQQEGEFFIQIMGISITLNVITH